MSTANPTPEQFETEIRIVAEATAYWNGSGGKDALTFAAVQRTLAEVPTLAMPPRGHSCPCCSRAGSMFCLTIAVERLRGQRPRVE